MVEYVESTRDMRRGAASSRRGRYAADAALGATARALVAAGAVTRPLTRLVHPMMQVALRPPLVPARAQPATWMDAAADRGAALRGTAARGLGSRIDAVLPVVASALDGHADLTDFVRGHVDLTAVATDLLNELDLAEIIRSATGATTSETLTAVRMRGMSADDALGHAMGGIRRKLIRPSPPSPAEP